MERAIELYREAFRKHGVALESILIPKGRQKERFDALTSEIRSDGFSILDYGCGFGHLRDYLQTKFSDFRYTGVDIVEEFIEAARQRTARPDEFFTILSYEDVVQAYDHIVVCGTFNTLYFPSGHKHWDVVRNTLKHLLGKTNKLLCCDFMTDAVDYKQPNAYHQNVVQFYKFATRELSRRLLLNQSYMPYEFSVVIFKDQAIRRPDNVYRPV